MTSSANKSIFHRDSVDCLKAKKCPHSASVFQRRIHDRHVGYFIVFAFAVAPDAVDAIVVCFFHVCAYLRAAVSLW